jgi:hypothetical protein
MRVARRARNRRGALFSPNQLAVETSITVPLITKNRSTP